MNPVEHTASRHGEPAVAVALAVAAALSFGLARERPAALLLGLLFSILAAASLRWSIGLASLLALAAGGVALRVNAIGLSSSDVLTVTAAAIQRVMSGGNPYSQGYAISEPPGAPFPYGPMALVWYLPFGEGAWRLELLVSTAIILLLAARGRPLGLALYAYLPFLVLTSTDGSNDTSAGLLLLAALVVGRRARAAGGFLLGLAASFKPLAAAWFPAFLIWGGLPGLIGMVSGVVLGWGPALVLWGITPVLDSVARSQALHRRSYFSMAWALESITHRGVDRDLFNLLRLPAGALAALATTPFARSHGGMVASGALVYLVTLYIGFWGTYAYLAALAPICCWYVDDLTWSGGQRLRWPTDPVGRLAARLDARWPIRGDPLAG